MNDQKLYLIEFLRFFASLMVVIWHYQHFFLPYNSNSKDSFDVLNSKMFNIFDFSFGILGVNIFFCISGFVFSYTYLNNNYISFKNFFYLRFARLYPLHFVTLLLVTIIQLININLFGGYEIYFMNDIKHFILNLFLFLGWGLEDGYSFNGPIWSVSVELFLYLVFFISIPYLKKYHILFSLPLLLFFIFIEKIDLQINDKFFLGLVLFFSGTLIFHIFKSALNKYYFLFLSILLIIVSLIGNFKITMFCPGIVMFFIFLDYKIKLKDKTEKIFEIFGNMTYASYLTHIPIQLAIILTINLLNLNFGFTLNFENTLVLFMFIILVYFISYFTFKLFEKPLNNFIKSKLVD